MILQMTCDHSSKCCHAVCQHRNCTLIILFTETVQLYIISFVSEKCVEIPVECMISINGQEVCIVSKSVQFKRICIFVQEDIY